MSAISKKAIFTPYHFLKYCVETAINYRVYTVAGAIFSVYFYGMIFNCSNRTVDDNSMEEKQQEIILSSLACPVHQANPQMSIGNDHITIRCCCNFFTRNFISTLNDKLKGKSFTGLLDDWETDLFVNELENE